jgi:Ca-activated chloride channel homolog
MSLDFERPWLLLLLPPSVAIVYLLWRGSRTYMPPVRRRASLIVRVAVISLLCLVLSVPTVQLRADQLAVAVLLDRSDSISPLARSQQEDWLAKAFASKGAQDQVSVITFGEDATVERALSDDPHPPRLAPDQTGTRTNIAAAIRAGVAALPPSAARRLVILSDGRENLDHADAAAALAAAAHVQLMSVPTDETQGPEVLVRALDAPAQLREGERFSVTAQLEATQPTSATLHLLMDGQVLTSQQVDLDQGTNRFVIPLEPISTGHHLLRLQVEADADTLSQNNSAGALVVVSGPPSVLVVEGTPGESQFLVDALKTSGLNVEQQSPLSAPLDLGTLRNYASVVLVDVAANQFAPGQLRALKTYVQNFGGGLVIAGGEHAYGPGSYARTPLEEMSPVRMDLRGKSVSASTALILVIDTSGSMGGGPGGASKMDLAKEAAISAAELLGEYDQIGIVAFEDQPRWVITPTPATDLGVVQAAIAEMQPGGGTEIYPALKMAYDGLAPIDAKVKHIILLTDGEAPRGDYPGLTQQMKDANITLSTIGIGSDADTALLQELATLGNGRYYDGNDPFDLPRLVVKETQQVQRAAIVEEDFKPVRISSGPALEGIDLNSMPPLRGYVATTPKPQSSVLLVSQQIDPVLAEWQYGLGRVIAWTSDVRNRWSSRWIEWPEFGRFWAQVVKRTTRPPEDPNRQVTVKIDGNHGVITLDAQTGVDATDRHYLNFLPTTATIIDPRGQEHEIQLPQVAPGRYAATYSVEDDGIYSLQVRQTEADGSIANQSSGFVVPYSPEYSAGGTDENFLEGLAKRTGGRLIHDPGQAFIHDLPAVGAPRQLWPYLLALVAMLFVADVGVRRVRITGPEMRAAYYKIRRRLGYVDSPALATRPVMIQSTPNFGLVSTARSRATPEIPTAIAPTRQGRLLAAKHRAARR